jgi:hypothetical protein
MKQFGIKESLIKPMFYSTSGQHNQYIILYRLIPKAAGPTAAAPANRQV